MAGLAETWRKMFWEEGCRYDTNTFLSSLRYWLFSPLQLPPLPACQWPKSGHLGWMAPVYSTPVIILGITGWLAVKFGGPMLKNRAASIANEISELEQAKRGAEEQMREFEARLRQIEREAEAITAEAKAEGELIKGKIIAQAEESAKRIVDKAAGQIALETEGAKRKLHEETMKAAVAMAEEVIRKNINNDDQKRLFKSYVENMGKMN